MFRHTTNDGLRGIFAQFICTPFAAILIFVLLGSACSLSFSLGCGVCCLANCAMYVVLFRHTGARKAKKIASAFYLGEVLKITFTAVAFGTILQFEQVHFPCLLGGYLYSNVVFFIPIASWAFLSYKKQVGC